MERRDFVFVSLLAVSFLLSSVILAGNGLAKHGALFQNERTVLESELVPEPTPAPELVSASEVEAVAEPETGKVLGEDSLEESVIASKDLALEAASQDAQEPAGKTQPQFATVGYEYFDDALFVGDSRMEGIMEYGNLENATFFADSGMSVFKLEKKQLSVPGVGKKSFVEILTAKQYGKIYLMLGLNELGYQESVVEQKYKEIVELIRANQSGAILYLCANLHVTEAQSQKDAIYNNDKVNWVNEMISQLADGERCIYIDINEVFDDETGSLNEEYSSDAFHVYAKHYVEWVDWLCTKGV